MNKKTKGSNVSYLLITLASFVIVIAGLRAAASIVVPFMLSIFIAIMCAPPLFWLQRKGIPTAIAVLIVVLSIIVVGLSLAVLVGTSLNDFTNNLDNYQDILQKRTIEVQDWLAEKQIDTADLGLQEYLNPGVALQMVANMLTGLFGMLTNTFMILLTVVFILLEASGLPIKLRAAIGDPKASLSNFSKFVESVNRYLAIKTVISLVTGIFISIWLIVLDVDYPILWGLLAFLLNYVPNIGSIIAAIPPVLLGLILYSPGWAMLIALGYLIVNIVLGSIIEPRVMGRGLGLSTLVVFLSLVFWGWVLGLVGMLLSVLLTMILKIALESNEETRWISLLLGPASHAKSAVD
jgi:AI-2 transport protein TqsA